MNDHIPSGLGAVDRVDSGAGAQSVHQVSAVPSDVVSVSEARFTPGPWRVDPFEELTIRAHDLTSVAHMPEWLPEYQDERRANARLIASAPKLLAALDGLLSHYVRLVDSGDAGNWDAETEPQVIAARAAIAAATGGRTA